MGAARILGRALAFGLLWGVAQGVWIVEPLLVGEHRLVPRTAGQWLILHGAFVAMCATVAVVLSIATTVATLAFQAFRRRPFRRWDVVSALAPMGLLPLTYLGVMVGMEWLAFHRSLTPALGASLGIAGLALVGASWWVYRRVAARPNAAISGRLVLVLAGVSLLGMALVPLRIAPPSSLTDDAHALAPRPSSDAARPPLLFVGLDSGNWETLRPLLAAGRLPTFARLIDAGVQGTVEAAWPPYWSGPAWAAILSGHPREETGVFGDLTVNAPGLPPFDAPLQRKAYLDPFLYLEWRLLHAGAVSLVHPPRAALHRTPIWQLLHDAGVETAVVRFDFTDPPQDQGTIVVSSRVGEDVWRIAGVKHVDASAIAAPPDLASELLALFDPAKPRDEARFQAVMRTSVRPPGQHGTLEMDMLQTGLDIDTRTFDAARLIVARKPAIPFLAVYEGGFDGVCHAFWAYRFPEAYGADAPAPELAAALGGVVDRYLEFLDATLGDLLRAYGRDVDVMIVADHGHTSSTDNPLWRGWHGPNGAFIAAGPSFPHRAEPVAVSYFDVVPTVLDVLGFAPPAGLHGTTIRGR